MLYSGRTEVVKDRPNEDTIRRRLRELTEQSRRIRAELADMIGGEEQSGRRFLHRESWSRPAPVPHANDRSRANPRKPVKKSKPR
jgi:hypothetical protein